MVKSTYTFDKSPLPLVQPIVLNHHHYSDTIMITITITISTLL